MSDTPIPRFRLDSPADMAQLVPYLIGFTPEESLAIVAIADNQVQVTARADLTDMQQWGAPENLLDRIWAQFPDANAFLIAYTQDPEAGREVKPGRKVYLVLNANQPKMIDMPKLVDLSKRQALSVIEILGLKVKELQYRPDPCVDCVIAQLYKGQPIAPDERIRRGEAITLVLGSGENGERVPVPDLTGLSMADVQLVLNMASLNLGVLVECASCNTKADSSFARVRRQSPSSGPNNRIALGSTIDLWLTADTAGLHPAAGWNDPARYAQPDSIDEP